MAYSQKRHHAVNSNPLPLFEWAERNRSRNHHISPLARIVGRRWGYSPEAAKAVCEAWGFDGGPANA